METPEAVWARLRKTLVLADIAQNLKRPGGKKPYTLAAISAWVKVPAELVVEVERITGLPREQLRPDLYRSLPWNNDKES